MPSEYAHYRFAHDVAERLSQQERVVAMANLGQFELGAHGPDVLFFYRPASHNDVNAIAHRMHRQPAMPFFDAALACAQGAMGRSQTELVEDLAYAYGFITHFALDSRCHPAVYQRMAETGQTHTALEVAFDRKLMVADGLDPVRYVRTSHLKATPENAQVMARFFPAVSPEQAHEAITTFKTVGRALAAPGMGKRALVYGALIACGHYRDQKGQMVTVEADPAFDESNRRFAQIYDEALPLAVRLIEDFRGALAEGHPLDARFQDTFGVPAVS